jgi:hypothetical protein
MGLLTPAIEQFSVPGQLRSNRAVLWESPGFSQAPMWSVLILLLPSCTTHLGKHLSPHSLCQLGSRDDAPSLVVSSEDLTRWDKVLSTESSYH